MCWSSMLPLRMLVSLMLMFLPCDADSMCPTELNPLTLNPPKVIAKYGELVVVNCTSNIEDHQGMYWRQGSITSDTEEDDAFTSWPVSLSDWNVTAECKIRLNASHECSKELEITVYKNPDLTINPTRYFEAAVEGTPYKLQCDILNVAPVQNLTVRWYKDNRTIKTETFNSTSKRPVNESSTVTVTMSRGENGAHFRCEAQLDFGPRESQLPVISNIRVPVHYAPELKNKTNVDELVFVTEGNNVTLNCEAQGNPPPVFNWTMDELNVSENESNHNIAQVNTNATYSCTATNYLGSTTKQIHVNVIKRAKTAAPAALTTPEASAKRDCPLLLTPAEIVVRFGDPALINCSTTATAVLGMGWEAAIKGTGFQTLSAVTWEVEKLNQWNLAPECYITLNDDYQCSMKPNITLYKPPDTVLVMDNGTMVEGTEHLLKCEITNVAPVQVLKVKWYRGNETVDTQMLNGTRVTPVNVSSTLSITPDRAYHGALFRCEAELHLGPKGPEHIPTTASSPYIAAVHYKPLFQACPHTYAGAEHEFSMDMLPCQVDGNPPSAVQWYYQGKPINASELLTKTHSGQYTAIAENILGRSNTSVHVTVEYGPSLSCKDTYEVEEGSFQTNCDPKGIPEPNTTWFKEGKEIATPQHWTKHDSGNYLVRATNNHGKAEKRLYIDVLYAPVFKEGKFNMDVTPGENVTLNCSAEGNPPPDIHWNYTSAVNARENAGWRQKSISVTGATSTNAGVYVCVATNKVGRVTRSVTLTMKGKTSAVNPEVIWVSLILLVIFIVIVVIVLHKPWKKRGQYHFVPENATDGLDIPMVATSGEVQV